MGPKSASPATRVIWGWAGNGPPASLSDLNVSFV